MGTIGGTQMVQEVGGTLKEDRVAVADALVGNCCCQMGFTATTGANQDQPALRFRSKSPDGFKNADKLFLFSGFPAPTLGNQVIKGKAGQRSQMTVLPEPGLSSLVLFPACAAAGKCPTKVSMNYRNVSINEADTAADRTYRIR